MGLVEESKDYDKLSAAGEPRGPRPQTQAPPTPAPSTSELTPPSDRSTMRQPRPLRIESARRNPPVQGPMNQMKRHY